MLSFFFFKLNARLPLPGRGPHRAPMLSLRNDSDLGPEGSRGGKTRTRTRKCQQPDGKQGGEREDRACVAAEGPGPRADDPRVHPVPVAAAL